MIFVAEFWSALELSIRTRMLYLSEALKFTLLAGWIVRYFNWIFYAITYRKLLITIQIQVRIAKYSDERPLTRQIQGIWALANIPGIICFFVSVRIVAPNFGFFRENGDVFTCHGFWLTWLLQGCVQYVKSLEAANSAEVNSLIKILTLDTW
jgi:hypothetical protein